VGAGEQSVKSLRARNDRRIFNGSPTRKPMNAARLAHFKTNRLLRLYAGGPHHPPRLSRGEGEYLINRSPSRLRDIRDLLAGTGLGTQP